LNLPKHMPALDGLRGIAILMVILMHVGFGRSAAFSFYAVTANFPPTFVLPAWLDRIDGAAEHGVQLFFVISAFTLTLRAMTNANLNAGYLLRRIARVGPAYWLAALGYTLLTWQTPAVLASNGVMLFDYLSAISFANAWTGGAALLVVPGGWSVSCEVTFYVVLPLLLWLINGRIWRAVFLTILSAALAQARLRHYVLDGQWNFSLYANPIQHAPVFLCGITSALIVMQRNIPRTPVVIVALLMTAIVSIPQGLTPPPQYLSPYLAFSVLAAAVVALAAPYPLGVLSGGIMRKVGEVSYSMYLVHFVLLAPCLLVAEWLSPSDRWPTLIICYVLTATGSFLVACVTYRFIERPAIEWAAARTRGTLVAAAVAAA